MGKITIKYSRRKLVFSCCVKIVETNKRQNGLQEFDEEEDVESKPDTTMLFEDDESDSENERSKSSFDNEDGSDQSYSKNWDDCDLENEDSSDSDNEAEEYMENWEPKCELNINNDVKNGVFVSVPKRHSRRKLEFSGCVKIATTNIRDNGLVEYKEKEENEPETTIGFEDNSSAPIESWNEDELDGLVGLSMNPVDREDNENFWLIWNEDENAGNTRNKDESAGNIRSSRAPLYLRGKKDEVESSDLVDNGNDYKKYREPENVSLFERSFNHSDVVQNLISLLSPSPIKNTFNNLSENINRLVLKGKAITSTLRKTNK